MTNEITLSYDKSFCVGLKLPDESSLVIGAPCQGGEIKNLSPKDLFAASIGSCMLMTMDISAKRHGFDIVGARISVLPVWSETEPGLAEIKAAVFLSKPVSQEQLEILRQGGLSCPVHNSLKPTIKTTITFEAA